MPSLSSYAELMGAEKPAQELASPSSPFILEVMDEWEMHSKGQRFRALVAVWWLLKERIMKGISLEPSSSAALPSTAERRADERRTLIKGREHAPCWRQATRSCSQLCPNSQLLSISFCFGAWGLILLFNTCTFFKASATVILKKIMYSFHKTQHYLLQ